MDSENSPKALVLILIVTAVGLLSRTVPAAADVPAHCLPNGSAIRFADVTGDRRADAIAVNDSGITVRPARAV